MLCKEGKVFFSLLFLFPLPFSLTASENFLRVFSFSKETFPDDMARTGRKVSQHASSSRPTTTQRFISCRWMSIIFQSGNRDALENHKMIDSLWWLSSSHSLSSVCFSFMKNVSQVLQGVRRQKKAMRIICATDKTQDKTALDVSWVCDIRDEIRHVVTFCVQFKLCSFFVSSLTHVSFPNISYHFDSMKKKWTAATLRLAMKISSQGCASFFSPAQRVLIR